MTKDASKAQTVCACADYMLSGIKRVDDPALNSSSTMHDPLQRDARAACRVTLANPECGEQQLMGKLLFSQLVELEASNLFWVLILLDIYLGYYFILFGYLILL